MISIRNLYKAHGARAVLRGVSAEVARGDAIAIVGPSGGGKSTLLRCLNGLESLDDGAVEIAGHVLAPAPRALSRRDMTALRARVGMVFQQFHLFPHLSTVQNVALAPRVVQGLAANEAMAAAAAMLARVGLADRLASYPHQLSGGQQQRVAIARAMVMRPEIMLFDEPTSSLDPELRGEVVRLICDLAAEGMTMLVVTHEMSVARAVGSRVWALEDGQLTERRPERLA